jgi:small subunit ribosomal protein S6
MKQYEITFIVDPVLSGDEISATAKAYGDLIKNEGCNIVATDEMGLRQLAYPINKRNSGVYYTHEFTTDSGDIIPKLELAMKRDERVMRYLTVRLDKYGVKYNDDKRSGKIAKKSKSGSKEKESTLKVTDDLTRIEGIGPKIAKLLGISGINSYSQLAGSDLANLQEVLAKGGSNYAKHDPKTWPQQAELAAAQKWDELDDLQKKLIGGVSSEEE